MANTLNVNARDWSTQDTSWVIPDGQIFWFDGNTELGSDVKYSVIGDGVTTVAELDRFLPHSVTSNTVFDRSLGGSRVIDGISLYSPSTSILRMVVLFDDTPKQDATAFVLDYDTLIARSGATTFYTFDGTETYGAPVINGREVYVIITGLNAEVTSGFVSGCWGSSLTATLS